MEERFKVLKQLYDKLMSFEDTEQYKWNFGTLYKETDCGSVGCAVGYLPILRPDLFKYRYSNMFHIGATPNKYGTVEVIESGCGVTGKDLGINEEIFDNIFFVGYEGVENTNRALDYYGTNLEEVYEKFCQDSDVSYDEADDIDLSEAVSAFVRSVTPQQVAGAIKVMLMHNYKYDIS